VVTTNVSRPAGEEAAAASASAIADPGPLGLGAFALTTFILSVFNAGLLNVGVESIVLSVAFFYGGGAQLLAGMWEFRKGNTFGATAFTSYAAFWLAYWGIGRFFAPARGTTLSDVNHAVGVFLLAWTIFTVYMCIAAMRTSLAVFGVFVVLALTFLALTIGKFADSSSVTKLGGWLGLLTAVLAWYASFAVVTNETWKRVVLPVGHRS
jgi:uncharacterized protein